MKSCSVVLYHELKKLLHDKKMLASMFFIPLFAAIFLGAVTSLDSTEPSSESAFRLYALNHCMEAHIIDGMESQKIEIIPVSCSDYEELSDTVELSQDDAAFFIENHSATIYYNSTSEISNHLALLCRDSLLSEYYAAMVAQNNFHPKQLALKELKDFSAKNSNAILALFLPYMLVLLLFTNVSNYTCDTIAGEKERGTFSKLLLTPVNASSIIIGKTISSMLCGLVSTALYFIILFIGSIVSRNLFHMELIGFRLKELSGTAAALIIVYAVLLSYLLASLAVLCSLFSKNSKEARAMLIPFMGVSIFASLLSILRVGNVSILYYFIPMYNLCITLQDILNSSVDIAKMAVTAVSLLFCAALILLITVISMKNEKIRY